MAESDWPKPRTRFWFSVAGAALALLLATYSLLWRTDGGTWPVVRGVLYLVIAAALVLQARRLQKETRGKYVPICAGLHADGYLAICGGARCLWG